ncbi:right-handed parallel beta-helix repeat-containing protein, partial [Streptomyces sp. NPDC004126]
MVLVVKWRKWAWPAVPVALVVLAAAGCDGDPGAPADKPGAAPSASASAGAGALPGAGARGGDPGAEVELAGVGEDL